MGGVWGLVGQSRATQAAQHSLSRARAPLPGCQVTSGQGNPQRCPRAAFKRAAQAVRQGFAATLSRTELHSPSPGQQSASSVRSVPPVRPFGSLGACHRFDRSATSSHLGACHRFDRSAVISERATGSTVQRPLDISERASGFAGARGEASERVIGLVRIAAQRSQPPHVSLTLIPNLPATRPAAIQAGLRCQCFRLRAAV